MDPNNDVLVAINGLAQEMRAGFARVDERFEQVDQRFEQVDQRFEQVDQRFEQVDQRFQSMEFQVANVTQSLHKAHLQIEHLGHEIRLVAENVVDVRSHLARYTNEVEAPLERRVSAIERRMARREKNRRS